MKWLRLYDEVLGDGKVQSLSDHHFRLWINLLCVANQGKPRGVIAEDNMKALAWSLHWDEADVVAGIAVLETEGLLERVDGYLLPHNWDARQFMSDDAAERMRAHRERAKTKPEPPPVPSAPPASSNGAHEPEPHAAPADSAVARTAAVLAYADFITDDEAAIGVKVAKSFTLAPDFAARDGPLEAEKFVSYFTSAEHKAPKDWYRGWLNWVGKARNDGPSAGRSAPRRQALRKSQDAAALRGYSYDALIPADDGPG